MTADFRRAERKPKNRVYGMKAMNLSEGVKGVEGGGGEERRNSVMQLKYFANQGRCEGAKV